MIVEEFAVSNGRTGRIFFRDGVRPEDAVIRIEDGAYEDPDDLMRENALRLALALPAISVRAYHGADPADSRHLYIKTNDGPLFVCVIMTERWVAEEIRQHEFVYETFSLQVAIGSAPTRARIEAAFESWWDRNFMGVRRRNVELSEWTKDAQDPMMVPYANARLSQGAAPSNSNIFAQPRKRTVSADIRVLRANVAPRANVEGYSWPPSVDREMKQLSCQ